jgi:outer membrane protein assembly factor BamA
VQQSDVTDVFPVFAIGAAYSPFAKTTITVELHERIYGSAALEGQDYRATGFMVGLNQELWENISAFLNVGYENADYFAVKKGIAADRVDHYVYVRVGPDWQVRPWWHLSSFYEFSNNDSYGIGNRPFTRNRVGIQANFEF